MSAETKRVSFMTIDTSSDFLKKPEKDTPAGNTKNKSFRLDLEIFEPDEYKFPEFNYKKLIYIEKKKVKKLAKLPNGTHNNDDPLAADDDDVARIAREMEAKYGTGSSYSKSSRMEFDRGVGYDDNDSFIDNTEAYDEQIPEDIETVRGGFYINSGLLEYKKLPNFERPGDEIRMPKAKKRVLSTSSESSGSDHENDQKKNKSVVVEKPKKKKVHIEKKIKSATSSSDEQGKAAKKLKKEKQEKQEKLEKLPEKPKETVPPVVAVPKEADKKKFVEKEATDDSKKVIKTTTVKDMLRAKRDNLRKLEQGKSSGGTTTTTDNDDDDGSESVSSLAVSESSHESNHEEVPINGSAVVTKELTFPANFSPELIQLITNLKQYAESTAKNNSNFFDNHVKEQLINIDGVAKSHSTQVRVQVYHQLETFIPCTRKTILAKVSRYRTQQADSKVKTEIKKLKTLINSTMPDLVRKYDEDLKTYENLKSIQHVVGDSSLEHKAPRKKYHWHDNSRQILCEIVQLIQDLYKISKVKKETIDEYTTKYLKDHLVPLWPEGWIKLEDFTKELERKKKKDAKVAVVNNSSTQILNQSITSTNGKQPTAQTQHHLKTEMKIKIENVESIAVPTVNGKSTSSGVQLSPQQNSMSVIKKASDHSINSIMSSSPSPPIYPVKSSAPTPVEIKPRVIDLEKLSSPNDLLKVSQKDLNRIIPKYSQHPTAEISPDKIRISDGSDSDCAIIDSPIKTTIKPQQQYPHHINNNKLNHSSIQQQQIQQGEMKKTKKHDDNYSNLIKNIASLTDPKKNNPSFLSNPLSTSLNDQRKMDTTHD
ncbi:yemanuclein isoform X2 [Chironomus tepperi]|uniref:yemanuclein isoform X2 n=1 Tax=Chironomus tepperi TaxID=113505 RepID=UPI00391F4DB0